MRSGSMDFISGINNKIACNNDDALHHFSDSNDARFVSFFLLRNVFMASHYLNPMSSDGDHQGCNIVSSASA